VRFVGLWILRANRLRLKANPTTYRCCHGHQTFLNKQYNQLNQVDFFNNNPGGYRASLDGWIELCCGLAGHSLPGSH
jgi:hypothetical protein